MEAIRIIDDGDTVVLFRGREYRYDSEFRFSFGSDDEFLEWALAELSNGVDLDTLLSIA